MNSNRLKIKFELCRVICVALLLCLGGGLYFGHRTFVRIDNADQSAISSILATTGDLVELYSKTNEQPAQESVNISSKLKNVIREQALVILTKYPNMHEMTAASFKGICLLVSNRDQLFQMGKDKDVEGLVDSMLNNRLAKLTVDVSAEYTSRQKRSFGAQQDCPGFLSGR